MCADAQPDANAEPDCDTIAERIAVRQRLAGPDQLAVRDADAVPGAVVDNSLRDAVVVGIAVHVSHAVRVRFGLHVAQPLVFSDPDCDAEPCCDSEWDGERDREPEPDSLADWLPVRLPHAQRDAVFLPDGDVVDDAVSDGHRVEYSQRSSDPDAVGHALG